MANNNSAIRAMSEEGKRLTAIHGMEDVCNFSLSNPNVPVPTEVDLAIYDILKEEGSTSVHGCMSSADYEDVRQAVAESLNKCFDTRFYQNNIPITMGAASGLNVVLKTLLNLEDEAIVFAPYFVEYDNYVCNYDGSLVVISPDTTNFESDLVELEQKINTRTKAVTINAPNDSTGMVYPLETLTKMADIMRAKEEELGTTIVLLSGESYGELAYNGVEVPYVTNAYDNIIIRYSCSKSLPLPGERVSYLVIPGALEDSREVFNAAIVANQVLGCVSAPSLMQGVIMRCLDAKVNLETYNRNRSLLYDGLRDLGFECIKPQGAFYLFVGLPEADEKKFCENCKKYNTLMVPGTSFACPGHVWVSYCVSYEQIEYSLPAFAKAATDYSLRK